MIPVHQRASKREATGTNIDALAYSQSYRRHPLYYKQEIFVILPMKLTKLMNKLDFFWILVPERFTIFLQFCFTVCRCWAEVKVDKDRRWPKRSVA